MIADKTVEMQMIASISLSSAYTETPKKFDSEYKRNGACSVFLTI
jgi:hypothetical protein